jgi:hypothetical protein
MTTERKVIASFSISPQTVDLLSRISEQDERSRSWIVDEAIKAYGRDRAVVDAQQLMCSRSSFLHSTILDRALTEHDGALARAEEHYSFVQGRGPNGGSGAMSSSGGIPVLGRSGAVSPNPPEAAGGEAHDVAGRALSGKSR